MLLFSRKKFILADSTLFVGFANATSRETLADIFSQHLKKMLNNLIEKWIYSDKKLYNLIAEIDSLDKTLIEKAEIAFEKLSKLYNIPRMPEDVDNEDDEEERRSLFEEHALIKFLANEKEDPRGIVLSAAFHLLNNYRVDLFKVAQKGFGKKLPEKCKIGIRGEGYYGEVVFPQKESVSWFDLGCKVMTQIN